MGLQIVLIRDVEERPVFSKQGYCGSPTRTQREAQPPIKARIALKGRHSSPEGSAMDLGA
jgi:hypothetical protein